METVGHKAGFLLDRIRRRPRPRNRQTRKSLCQRRIEEGVLDLRAIVLAASTTRLAMSLTVRVQPPRATWLGPVHRNGVAAHERARSARRVATFKPLAGDPPKPWRRHHHLRRSLAARDSAGDDGDVAIKE